MACFDVRVSAPTPFNASKSIPAMESHENEEKEASHR